MKEASVKGYVMKDIGRWGIWAAATTGLLAACGGGGGTSDTGRNSLTLTGIAATGAAMAKGTVTAKCRGGTATSTSGDDGRYSLEVPNASLPCVLQGIAADGLTTLYSAAPESSDGKANITPVSDLIVAAALPAGSFLDDAFKDGSALQTLSSDQVKTAQALVTAALKPVADFSSSDPLKDAFTASATVNGSAVKGTGQDLQLDALKAHLTASGVTFAGLRNVVAAALKTDSEKSENPDAQTASTALSAALASPVVPNCPAIREGTFRTVDWVSASINTIKLVRNGNAFDIYGNDIGQTGYKTKYASLIPNNTEPGDCAFSLSNGLKGAFTMTGAFAFADASSSPTSAGFGFPVQAPPPLAALAGDWNLMSLDDGYGDKASSHLVNWFGKVSVTTTGGINYTPYVGTMDSTGTYRYDSLGTTFSANLQGNNGMYQVEATTCSNASNAVPCAKNGKPQYFQRALPWRAANGALMAVFVGYDRGLDGTSETLTSLGVLSKAVEWPLPKVGDTFPASWQVTYAGGKNNKGVYGTSMLFSTADATTVSAITGSKMQTANSSTASFDYNSPVTGLRHKTDSATASDVLQMNTGTGFIITANAVSASESKVRYTVSVSRKQ